MKFVHRREEIVMMITITIL